MRDLKNDSVLQIRLPLKVREDFIVYCQELSKRKGVKISAGELLRDTIFNYLENPIVDSKTQDWVDIENANTLPLLEEEKTSIKQNKLSRGEEMEKDFESFKSLTKSNISPDQELEVITKMIIRYEKNLLNKSLFPFYEIGLFSWGLSSNSKKGDALDFEMMILRDRSLYKIEFVITNNSIESLYKVVCSYDEKTKCYEFSAQDRKNNEIAKGVKGFMASIEHSLKNML